MKTRNTIDGITRSAMAKRILRKLKEWEGSRMTEKTAQEVLDVCEKAGMLPPVRNADQKSSYGYARIWEWKTEKKRARK